MGTRPWATVGCLTAALHAAMRALGRTAIDADKDLRRGSRLSKTSSTSGSTSGTEMQSRAHRSGAVTNSARATRATPTFFIIVAALASGPSTDVDLAGNKASLAAGGRDATAQQASALEAAHTTIKKLQAELDRLAADNDELQQQLRDAQAERETWMNEHDPEAHAAHEVELAEALRLADQK